MARDHRAASARPGRRAASFRAIASVALVAGLVGACGNTPTPSPSTAAPTSTGPVTSAAPTPAPTATPQEAAIGRFVALVTKAEFSYQATFSGEDRHSASVLRISNGLLQVHGDDVRVRATFTDRTGSTVVEHRYVAGKGWLRFASVLPWQRQPMTPATTMAAFAAVASPQDVTFVQTVKSGGKSLYLVRFDSAIVSPAIVPYINLSDEAVRKATMTVLIDDAGRPIRGTDVINATGRISGQLQEIVIELSVAFTKVGEKVSISAP